MRKLIEKVYSKIQEYPQDNVSEDAYGELLSAHKELVEILESEYPQTSQEECLVLIQQSFKFVEKARYQVGNLDILKWLVSYSWNQGTQRFK